MFKKLREFFSVQLSKNPGRIVLLVILLLNIAFVLVSAAIISALKVTGTENLNFWEAAYRTITMILDAGCIGDVVSDIGEGGVALAIVCLVVVIIGMVLFTGAVIGYLTNYISHFIEQADGGKHKLHLYGHTVILNWNSRANEIVNDFLYCDKKQTVVVLASSGKEQIERELSERIASTVDEENERVRKASKDKSFFARLFYRMRHKFRDNITIIVREGDPFSEKQLRDISLEHAKSIIILGNEYRNTVCQYELREIAPEMQKGNPQIIKSLVLVSDITSALDSDDDQKIVVESEDDWTGELIDKVIAFKQVDGKCNIIPVNVNTILGRLLSQFSLMPELNLAYRELFSNKGATFYPKQDVVAADEVQFVRDYIATHSSSIPLSILDTDGRRVAYYCADSTRDDSEEISIADTGYRVKLNCNYWMERKNVVILGHNSKIKDIMEGFDGFRNEWNYSDGREIMNIIVIDDKDNLERMGYYKDYPYVTAAVEADLYDKDKICDTIEQFTESNENDTSILILSDDLVPSDETDSGAITNLIYVTDIIRRKKQENPDFDEHSIDVIVEILDPKHYDVVKSYSVNNVVISNRYISKMITQIGEKDDLFNFYVDILSYDEEGADEYDSKEIYVKKVSQFFEEVPAPCTAYQLVRAVYEAGQNPALEKSKRSHTIVLGYVGEDGKITLFSGNLTKMPVALTDKDKLIVFSNH